MSLKLIPGSQFPSVEVKTVAGETVNLQANGEYKLVVVYRGQFCPFCKGTLTNLNERYEDLKNADIKDVIAVSADPQEVTKEFVEANGFTFPIACGLSVPQIRTIGTYLSSPTNYIPQEYDFSEPAWFLLSPDNSIKYIDIGSAPFAGRPDIDNLLAGFAYVKQRSATDPAFKTHVWGSK